jgi:F0F1-type ATP synthase assembly protein I
MPDQQAQQGGDNKNIWRQIGRYSHLGLVLPASVLVGILIGAALDHWLGTRWITLVGLLLGCVAGIIELTRAIIQLGKET